MPNMNADTTTNALHAEQQALLATLSQLLEPIAKLCLAKGVPIQAVEETVRRAYVQTATQACKGLNPSRLTSRISTMTKLTRREVARLQSSQAPARAITRSVATDMLAHWTTRSDYVNKKGLPITLPRTGPEPSFESLAASVTQDVHAKSVLAEMVRLSLAHHNTDNDTVSLQGALFVPSSDWPRMVGFMGDNVGDHLQAAVDNVLGDGHQHFEQSLLADELSSESLGKAKSLISAQWRELLTQLGPQLQALMDQDKAQGRTQDQQLRVGLYSYMTAMPQHITPPDHPGASHAQGN